MNGVECWFDREISWLFGCVGFCVVGFGNVSGWYFGFNNWMF